MKLTVVLSQAQGKHPARRALEESLVAALIMEPGIEVSVVPHLYDLGPDHTGRLFLEGVRGDLVVLSWLYPRAAYWVLDRDGIKGHWGESELKSPHAEEDDEAESAPEPPKGIGALDVPDRTLWCLDLRDHPSHEPYLQEIRRLAALTRSRGREKDQERARAAAPAMVQLGMAFGQPTNGHAADGASTNGHTEVKTPGFAPEQLLQPAGRRWYPVIDYSRCTNCLECLDFCLFGVYGVDPLERIHVEHQDNCKKGCPACSRVCPEQAIIFPEYKTPAIAGAPVGEIGGLKIDLSRLFGGEAKDALSQAVEERDRELVADGRTAVGMAVGIPKRQEGKPQGPKDDLDRLTDALDDLEL